MNVDEEHLEQQLLAVFEHYDIPEPATGERPFKCPIHEDSRASASVNRSKGLWNCHGCGSGGTGVGLVQLKEGLAFPEALEFVRKLTGGLTPTTQKRRTKRTGGRWIPPSLRSIA